MANLVKKNVKNKKDMQTGNISNQRKPDVTTMG